VTAARVVFVTAPAGETADAIARDLIEKRLAACVNVVRGVSSVYRWKGNVESDTEDLLVVKTSADSLDALEQRIKEIHPYSLPEFIVLPVVSGSRDYLDWVMSETRKS